MSKRPRSGDLVAPVQISSDGARTAWLVNDSRVSITWLRKTPALLIYCYPRDPAKWAVLLLAGRLYELPLVAVARVDL